MAFIESPRFPDDISYGSSGGPKYRTHVVTVTSGYETRNQKWVNARHEYDAQFGIASVEQLSNLNDYFHAMLGKKNGFRYKDWGDFKSCGPNDTPASSDQEIGTGTGTTGSDGQAEFQVIKTYSAGEVTERDINKLVDGTLLVEVDGVPKTIIVDYTVDYDTGLITFTSGNIPLVGEVIKCGYEFDVPCRFDTDTLNINFSAYGVGDTTVPIIEIRL